MARRKMKLDVASNDPVVFKAFAGKDFSPHHLVSFKPKTQPQKQFVESYYAQVPIIVQQGSAGTGKTAIALYCALSEVLDKSTVFSKVVLVRSAVQARDIGFLKGSEEEKNEAYEMPYKALCNELLTFKSNNYENLKAKGLVEFYNTSFLRGITLDESIIIVDEFQSLTYHELSTIMTRTGINSKIIFCGDIKQNDLHRKNDVSGLGQFMKVLERMPSHTYDIITYRPQDIVRSGIVKEFLLAEESMPN